jgi:signal transduction histidine kinase
LWTSTSKTSGENWRKVTKEISSKLSGASVTGWRSKYNDDPFFRTQIQVVGLQFLFVVLILVFFTVAVVLIGQHVDAIISSTVHDVLGDSAPQSLVPTLVERTQGVRAKNFSLFVFLVVPLTAAFSFVLAQLTLAPSRNALSAYKQFIGNVAHELRTPLAVLKTNTELALMHSTMPTDMRSMLDSNVEELDRINQIINNLLSLTTLIRPEQMEFTSVDVSLLTSDVLQKMNGLARKNAITVTVRKSEEAYVWGNLTALEQIFSNLIKNAITYTPRGGSVVITISPTEHSMTEIIIRDSGIGIARKDLFRIFEPFYRADPSRSREGGGSGLGLTIVSELVKLHHGRISVRSVVGHGTTISVRLPRSKESPASRHQREKKAAVNEINVDYTGGRTG